MKYILFALGTGLISVATPAASITGTEISGRVLDQENKPVEFAIVTLLHANDSSLVKGGVTTSDGGYLFDNCDTGRFLVAVTFTGYEKGWQGPFAVSGQNTKLPDIILLPLKNMNTVTVTATQPLFVRKPDKLIMNVENSPVRIVGTAWDLIAKAPGVFVDQNNNITLHGKSGVVIYVDGKNTYLNGDQLVTYLQNISAADVVQLEIISNPSAKYDAQGSGGIIDIITKKGEQQGFNGNVRGAFGEGIYPKSDGGFGFNYAKEKFNIYGRAGFSDNTRMIKFYINRNIPYNNITTNFNQNSTSLNNSYGPGGRLGIDFYAKHNITWGMRSDFSLGYDRNHAVNSTWISSSANDSASQLYQLNTDRNLFENYSGNIYFRQKFDTLGTELSASADYLGYHIDNNSNFNLNYYDNSGSILAPSEFQRSRSLSDISIAVGQVDFSKPLGKQYKIETGIKNSYVKTDNDLRFDILNNNNWKNDTSRSNRFIYGENINAAYVNGYATFGNWQFEGGLRAEQTISDGNSPTTGQHLKRSYVQLFPSVFVLQKLNNKSSLNYNYSRRVNRPDYQNLNPFKSYLDKYTYELGNPFLQPEIQNNIEITWSFMDAVFITASGSQTKNAMTDVTQQVDSTGIGYKTTVNLNTVYNAYLEISSPVPLGKFIMMENDLSFIYSRYKSPLFGTPIDVSSKMFNGSSDLSITLPANFKFQVSGWYNSPGRYGIFQMKSAGGVGCGISKSFFDKKLSVVVNVRDIFRTSGMRATISGFQNQDVQLHFSPESPVVYFRARYAFGNTKATRKTDGKTGADDLQQRSQKK